MDFKDWIKNDCCFVNLEVKNSQELFQKMAEKFLAQDLVKSTYLAALTSREKDYPTGLAMGDGINIAIPHTDPEHINQNRVVVVSLKEPIEFIHMATTDQVLAVRLCFFILSNQGHMQIDLLNKLLSLAQNEQIISKLINSINANELYESLIEVL